MSSPSIQVDGVQTKEMIDVYYTGSDTLKPGQVLCYDSNYAGYTAGTTAENLTENIRRRASYVEKPGLDNLDHIAGYVAFGQPNLTGPRVIKIIPFEGQIDRAAVLYGNLSFTAGDLLGLAPGSYNISKWTVGPVLGMVQETVDRSTTAGTVRAWFGALQISESQKAAKCVRFFDDFTGDKQAGAADVNAYLISGTSASMPFADDTNGGVGVITMSTTNIAGIQLNGEPFVCQANKPLFFRARVAASSISATSADFVGVAITDTSLTASDPSDYVAFKTANGVLTLESRKASGTKATLATGTTLVAATFTDLAFYWDGNATFYAWQDGTALTVTQPASTAIPTTEALTASAERGGNVSGATLSIDRWEIANAR